ncbi:conserved hypothetical protein [Uncinocarpus reesii 1704]|uniref:Tyrosinase copper-binding domain-containing protein n=1 Tax=Uncinocarpus reesii (strain UAMH 1704) TaxID=336963 RepID=C4JXS4_UNCRE|nr:uncharacterized protein UREG_07862 [Uncinocarpus reesii 1704]EEP82997.1 conserved hypothetical protein [Uncinocarpus reesii 1704]
MTLKALSVGFFLSQVLAVPAPRVDADAIPFRIPPSAASSIPEAQSQLDGLASFAYGVTKSNLESGSERRRTNACTLSNLSVRREWSTFTVRQRKAYIDAVLCLQKLPAKTPSSIATGAKSRYDDFVATHVQQTLGIHHTGTFLAWHRYYVHEYDQALRNECSYKGDYPYWDWPLSAVIGMENHPIFDGSDTSLSGNGKPIPNQGDIVVRIADFPPVNLPSGTGGGCVTSGPFKDYVVNLGPAVLLLPGDKVEFRPNPLDHNPRCLKRDLTDTVIKKYANATAVVDLILRSKDIESFQTTMQGALGSDSVGVHGGGHFALGGDPGRDVFVSPGDPAFFLHHGMIDRVWWIWQSLDPKNRRNAIHGTGTFLNQPPSPNTTLDTLIDLGHAGGSVRPMRDLMSTTDGPFCYTYL